MLIVKGTEHEAKEKNFVHWKLLKAKKENAKNTVSSCSGNEQKVIIQIIYIHTTETNRGYKYIHKHRGKLTWKWNSHLLIGMTHKMVSNVTVKDHINKQCDSEGLH